MVVETWSESEGKGGLRVRFKVTWEGNEPGKMGESGGSRVAFIGL